MKIKNPSNDSIQVNEEFTSIDTRPLDSKHRITLSEKIIKAVSSKVKRVDSYQILVGKNGDILLRPAVSIPAREAWIYESPEVLTAVRKGLQQAKQGKVKEVRNPEDFFDSL